MWAKVGLAKVGHPNSGQNRSIIIGESRLNKEAKVGIGRLVASKLLVLPADQYLDPVVPDGHPADLLPSALCSVRNCCKNVVAVDPKNKLSRFPFDGLGEFMVPLLFFFNSSSQCARLDGSSFPIRIPSARNLMLRKMPSKNVSSMFPRKYHNNFNNLHKIFSPNCAMFLLDFEPPIELLSFPNLPRVHA